MKKLLGVTGNAWVYSALSCLLAFLMVFTLLPHDILAQNLKAQPDIRGPLFTGEDGSGNIPAEETFETAPLPEKILLTDITSSEDNEEITDSNPPAVTTGSPVDITSNSAIVKGSLASLGSADIVQVGFEYGETTDLGFSTELIDMPVAGEFSLRLNDLKPDTVYYFRAVAASEEGAACGDTGSFATLPEETGSSANDTPFTEAIVADTNEAEPEATPEDSPEAALTPTPQPESGSEEEDNNEKPKTNKVTQRVQPDQDAVIKSASERIQLAIPQGAVSEELDIEITELHPVKTSLGRMVRLFELNASNLKQEKVKTFSKSLSLSICHDNEDIGATNPESLRLYYRDEDKGEWVLLPDSAYDLKTNTLTATTDHFSQYAEIGANLESGPGRVMASQVGLHSGAATFNYPIELPPGPGGFTPKLELNYSSASVNEMKDYQDTASWVGTGWSLSFGSISTNLDTKQYFLDLNGSSYEIISDGNNSYHTLPEQYFKITRDGGVWEMYDREGVYYRFGGSVNSDSVQMTYTTDFKDYRWDLNLIRDTNGNEATISYQRVGSDVYGYFLTCTAHPQYLRYNNNLVEVKFTWSYDDEEHDVRYDNPVPMSGFSTPYIMETRRLDSIEIRVSGSLVRKYAFTYNDLSDSDYLRHANDDAGSFKLLGLTQYGADGTTALPSLTFEYLNKQIFYRSDDSGNGMIEDHEGFSRNWPYLTKVNSGYGGSVEFVYTQLPNNGTTPPSDWNKSYDLLDSWSREVVTEKTTTPGIGPEQTIIYAYTGSPVYLGIEKNMQFRGFPEVKETDEAANYVKHYYYTTGFVNGQDYEKLSGREYLTEWYDSTNTLLRKTSNTYSIKLATPINEGIKLGIIAGAEDEEDEEVFSGLATSSNGVLYAADGAIHTFTATGYELGIVRDVSFVCDVDFSQDNTLFAVECHTNELYRHKLIKYVAGSPPYDFGSLIYPFGLTVSDNGYVFVSVWNKNGDDTYYISKFDTNLQVIEPPIGLNLVNQPKGIAASDDGYIYVASYGNGKVVKFNYDGVWQADFTDPSLVHPWGIAVSDDGFIYVGDTGTHKIIKFNSSGAKVSEFSCDGGKGLAFSPLYNYLYVSSTESDVFGINIYSMHFLNWTVNLNQVDETTYSISAGENKNTRIRYTYDDYGNVVTEFHDGDISPSADPDESTIWRTFYPDTDTYHILSKPARERVYAGGVTTDNGVNVKNETKYYYDKGVDGSHDDNHWDISPIKGNLTRLEQKKDQDQENTISNYYEYDGYGNKTREIDPNNNSTTWTYESIYHTYPATKTYPAVAAGQFTESYTYDPGTNNLLTQTDINGGVTTYFYDTFKRLVKVARPGDEAFFGLKSGNSTSSVANNKLHLNAFVNKAGNGTLTRLDIKFNQTSASGKVRLGVYQYFEGYYVRQLDAGEANAGTSWVSINNLNLTVDDNTTYFLAFVMSGTNTLEYQSSYGSGTHLYKTQTYGSLPYTPTGFTTNTSPFVMRALVTGPETFQSVKIEYKDWGTIGNQNIKTTTKNDYYSSLWQAQYFDGLGRVVQTQAQGESGHTIITGTTVYNNRGLVDRQYVSQDISSVLSAYYNTGIENWKYTTFTYDALGRVVQQTNADSTTVSTDYSTAWQTTVTNQRNAQNTYKYDAFNRLIEVNNLVSNICSGWNAPASYSSATATSPANAYISDDVYASASVAGKYAIYNYFNIPVIPSGATINGIQVGVEGHQSGIANSFDVYLSYNGGASYTALKNTGTMGTTETTRYAGGATDAWGRTWSAGEFTNTNFMIKIVWKYSYVLYLDCIKVKVFYTDGVQTSTQYTYDVLGNLTDVYDNSSNHTQIYYNMLSRKTSMTDPDMGSWSYGYDNNGNLTTQTDAFTHTITMAYDVLNRLTGKTYPSGLGMTNVSYAYDSTTGGNYGKGKRTGMSDALGTNSAAYVYDIKGRLVSENKVIDSTTYTTAYTYDGLDRLATITYPGGEVVTNTYNDRGLPKTLTGSSALTVVTGTTYNALGNLTEIDMGSTVPLLKTTYGYYGTGGTIDKSGGQYGRLWEIKTVKPGTSPLTLQDIQHTWDAAGNLSQRQDLVSSETENFSYDYLDRLVSTSGSYSESFSYDTLGNITSKTTGGTTRAYTYGSSKPHAVTLISNPTASYTYDNNGNMNAGTARTWDVENRLTAVTKDSVSASFTYDGDGNRVKKIEGGVTTIYVNKYYEKTGTTVTTYYYLGGKLVANRVGTTLSYILQDHLGSTSVTASSGGVSTGTIRYFGFGDCRNSTGTIPTDKKFTGQRLDQTGLYYYGARYYDATIGRFISPDTFNLDFTYPQGLNRYSYCFNNPLRYNDPTGNWPPWDQIKSVVKTAGEKVKEGLQVAQSKVTEIKQAAEQKAGEVKQAVDPGIEKIENVQAGPTQSSMRVITVRKGGLADRAILKTIGGNNTWGMSLYPAGIVIDSGTSQQALDHEAFHQWQQKNWKTTCIGWYIGYLSEMNTLTDIFGNSNEAYKYCSFEQEARISSGEQSAIQIPSHLNKVLKNDPRLAQMIYDYFYNMDPYYYILIKDNKDNVE